MTTHPTDVPELDIAGVLTACRRRVLEVCPEQLPFAVRLLDRLQPPRWALEWYLPWWVGHAFGLEPAIATEIVLSNVLGLVSIRLQDDLLDGDVSRSEVAAATTLSAALYEEAVRLYRARFDPSSPFWRYLDTCMSDWQAATHGNERTGHAGAAGEDDVAMPELAQRGAPLKICAFAVCLLTGRADAFPVLDRCLDHALAAMVLYDHVCDWEDDLDAGRWNAFVASLSAYPQVPQYHDQNRSTTLVAMMANGAVTKHFSRITRQMARAVTLSEGLQLWPLAAHFRDWATRTDAQGDMVQAYYRDVADRATRLLLGHAARSRS